MEMNMGYTASYIKVDRIDKMWEAGNIRIRYADRFYAAMCSFGLQLEPYAEIPRSNIFKFKNSKNKECFIYYTGGFDWWAFSKNTIDKLQDKTVYLVIQAYPIDNPNCHFWIAQKPQGFDSRGRITFQDRGGFAASPRVNDPNYVYGIKYESMESLKEELMKG